MFFTPDASRQFISKKLSHNIMVNVESYCLGNSSSNFYEAVFFFSLH